MRSGLGSFSYSSGLISFYLKVGALLTLGFCFVRIRSRSPNASAFLNGDRGGDAAPDLRLAAAYRALNRHSDLGRTRTDQTLSQANNENRNVVFGIALQVIGGTIIAAIIAYVVVVLGTFGTGHPSW